MLRLTHCILTQLAIRCLLLGLYKYVLWSVCIVLNKFTAM